MPAQMACDAPRLLFPFFDGSYFFFVASPMASSYMSTFGGPYQKAERGTLKNDGVSTQNFFFNNLVQGCLAARFIGSLG